MNRSFFIIAPLSLCINTSFAGDSCDSLLTVGIYNVNQSSSATESQSLAKSTFCAYDYSKITNTSSQAASIKASYKLFSGDGSYAASDSQIVELQHSVCTSGYDSTAYSNEASSYSKIIYQGALDAWNQCNALSQKGLDVEIQTDNKLMGATITFTNKVGTSSQFQGLSQLGLGNSICKTQVKGKIVPVTEKSYFKMNSSSKLTVVCQRELKNDGKDNLLADDETLVFNTSTGAYQVPMAHIGSLARSTVDQALGQIRDAVDKDTQTQIAPLSAQLDSHSAQLGSHESFIGAANSRFSSLDALMAAEKAAMQYTFVPRGTSCPNGWTYIGTIGMITYNREPNHTYEIGPGGAFSSDWAWFHPFFCKRN